MRLYCLQADGQTLCEVDMDTPAWLPARPRLNRQWLRALISKVLHDYFLSREPIVRS